MFGLVGVSLNDLFQYSTVASTAVHEAIRLSCSKSTTQTEPSCF